MSFNAIKPRIGKSPSANGSPAGFTLLELLMVVAIIGILATVALPHLSGFGKGNAMKAATSQLMDDLALARQKAVATRSKVYVVFLPQSFWTFGNADSLGKKEREQITNLWSGQLRSYALYSPRSVGDQPGHANSRYLTAWKTLPDGVLIAPDKFEKTMAIRWTNLLTSAVYTNTILKFETNQIVFPRTPGGLKFNLPQIGFSSEGRLLGSEDECIPLSRGGALVMENGTLSITEMPPGNATNSFTVIRIDAVTGRAKLERQEIQ